MAHPSGEQWQIEHGNLVAVVTEVGGGLRSLRLGDHDVVAGYEADEMASAGRGQVLVPWPNRMRDGRYTFDGQEHTLPVTELRTGTASHGLTRWEPWRLRERHDDAVVVAHTIHPRPGWPFHVEVTAAWVLDSAGLTCTTQATNVGPTAAPWGYGAHPYLALGSTPAADARLTVPAEQVLTVDDRGLPADLVEVSSTPLRGSSVAPQDTAFDLRDGGPLGDREIDHAYTGLARGEDRCWQVELATDVLVSRLWGGPGLDWVQVFTGRARGEGGVPGVAVEPLSCPADAYNTGVGLVRLEPGQTWTAQWGIESRLA